MSKLVTERGLSSVLLLMATCALIYSTFGLEFAQLGGAFSPMFFPRIILFFLLALAFLNVIIEITRDKKLPSVKILPLIGVSIGIFGYVLLLVPIGFFFSSIGVGVVLLICLGIRNPLSILIVPTLCAGLLIVLFNHVLKMPLPTSPFFWWL